MSGAASEPAVSIPVDRFGPWPRTTMSKVTLTAALVVRFVVFARETDKLARKVEEEHAIREVLHAVHEYEYAKEVTS